MKTLVKKLVAECLGTAVLVFFACGTAVLTGVNVVATALAFGLVIVAMAFSIGNISGCHINPAVSLGMAIRKEISWAQFGYYVIAQFIGGIIGALLLGLVLRCQFQVLGQNSIQLVLYNNSLKLDAGSYISAFAIEVILTFVFVFAVIGATDKKNKTGKFAGLIIGATLVLVHLIGINLTGTSVNPARSFGPALISMLANTKTATTQLQQIWIWLLAPMAGGALAAVTYTFLTGKKLEENQLELE